HARPSAFLIEREKKGPGQSSLDRNFQFGPANQGGVGLFITPPQRIRCRSSSQGRRPGSVPNSQKTVPAQPVWPLYLNRPPVADGHGSGFFFNPGSNAIELLFLSWNQ